MKILNLLTVYETAGPDCDVVGRSWCWSPMFGLILASVVDASQLGSSTVDSWTSMYVTCILMSYALGTFWALRDAISVLILGPILPYLYGCCYLKLFQLESRFKAYSTLGKHPMWEDVLAARGLDYTVRVEYEFGGAGSRTVHLGYDKDGFTISELRDKFNQLQVGGNGVRLPVVGAMVFGHQVWRMFLWMGLFLLSDGLTAIAVVMTVAMLSWFKCDTKVGSACVAFATWITQPTNNVTGFVSLWVFGAVAFDLATDYWLTYSWQPANAKAPSADTMTAGVSGSSESVVFSKTGLNCRFDTSVFREDASVSSQDRAAFVTATGLEETSTMHTGNPHALAAQISRYFRWKSTGMESEPSYIVNVGGTWKGWPETACGLAIQPTLGNADAAVVRLNQDQPGLERQVVGKTIATDCGAVGVENRVEWDPMWNVTGIGGAIMWMIHCYEIPVKALLGIAYANNTPQVLVVMHGAPSLFKDNEGYLPWSRQRFEHLDDNTTRWSWMDTPGRTWYHNTRLVFEHFFTDYVKVAEDCFYVCDLHRTVLDVYMFRWTRTSTQPTDTRERQLTMPMPRDAVVIPMMRVDKFWLPPTVTPYLSVKAAEEYLHKSADLDGFMVSMRATVDSYSRNFGCNMYHADGAESEAMWRAEVHRRWAMDLASPARKATELFGATLGLLPGSSYDSSMAVKLLALLTRQPLRSVSVPLLRHDFPYVQHTVIPADVVPREPYMADYDTAMLCVSQDILDVDPVPGVVKLKGQGGSLTEALCFVLFGRWSAVGSILPLGDRHRGGSLLSADGTGLLSTEMWHLMLWESVVLVVRWSVGTPGEVETEWFQGPVHDDRPIVVYLDVDNGAAYRVHYGKKSTMNDVRIALGATRGDFANRGDAWNRVRGEDSPRAYEAYTNAEDLYRAELASMRHVGLERVAVAKRAALIESFDRAEIYHAIPSTVVEFKDVPTFEYNPHIQVYDGANTIGDYGYLPPHLYAAKSVKVMCQLMGPSEGFSGKHKG